MLIILFIVLLKIEKHRLKSKHIFIFIFTLLLGILIGFGNNLFLFINRIIKNTDGTFIILQERLYNNNLFEHNFWIQIFKVITFKIGFEKQEVGEILASYSKYHYVLHGGPNDNIITYYLMISHL